MNLKLAIKNKNIAEIRKIVRKTTLPSIGNILEKLNTKECIYFFRVLKTDTQSDIFAFLKKDQQEKLINAFSDNELKGIINDLWTDDIVDLIEEVPSEIAQKVLKSIDNKEIRNQINLILRYDENQIGSFMSPNVALLKQNWTVGQARDYLRDNYKEIIMNNYLYVVNHKNKLIGYITNKNLILKTRDFKIKNLIKPITKLETTMNKEEASIIFSKNKLSCLPVINSQKVVVGMITSDDVIDIIQESATEDIQKMVGIEYKNEPYLKISVFNMAKSRFLWLLLLLFSATISQIVLEVFQNISSDTLKNELSKVGITTLIVAIVPVISGAAGNAGSQSSTMIVRALATGEITTKDYLKVMIKEMKVAMVIASLLSITNFLRLIIYYLVTQRISDSIYILISFGASIALFFVVILSKLIGGILPIIAKKFNIDPAAMASPILATLLDALSIIILFGTIIVFIIIF